MHTEKRQFIDKKKTCQCRKLQLVATKVPPVRVSDSGRMKIIILNVIGLLCDIRSLRDKREWGNDLVIHYVTDLNEEKKTNCDKFLSMLCSYFDVGICRP
jgi:hypothetical protein